MLIKDIGNFYWGDRTSNNMMAITTSDFFDGSGLNVYERFFVVETDDIVLDIGASLGTFTYTILHKNPKHCYVIEPLPYFFNVLKRNLEGNNVSFTRAAIGYSEYNYLYIEFDGEKSNVRSLTFRELIDELCLNKIDFLKTDCEGGEYDIFQESNLDILLKIPKIAGEFHIDKEKFRYVRDVILPHFKKFEFFSIDGVDIKWDLYNEHFLDYYKEVLFYIDNRNEKPPI